jgi:hypothetical protein
LLIPVYSLLFPALVSKFQAETSFSNEVTIIGLGGHEFEGE